MRSEELGLGTSNLRIVVFHLPTNGGESSLAPWLRKVTKRILNPRVYRLLRGFTQKTENGKSFKDFGLFSEANFSLNVSNFHDFRFLHG